MNVFAPISKRSLLVVNNLSEIAAAGAAAQSAARSNLGIGSSDAGQLNYLGLGMTRALGRLQIVSGTTSADAIYFGSDVPIYRDGANSLTIGATSAVNFSGGIFSSGTVRIGSAAAFQFTNQGLITSPSDGVFLFRNNAGTGFGRIQLGGTTNASPAMKPSGADMHFVVADDSGFANVKAGSFTVASGAFLMRSSAAWGNGAGAGMGTLLNAPSAGNPTKWIPVDDAGTTRYVPAW